MCVGVHGWIETTLEEKVISKQKVMNGLFVTTLQPSSAGSRVQNKIIGIILTHKLLPPIPKLGAIATTVINLMMDIARIMRFDINAMNIRLQNAVGANGWIETTLEEKVIMKL